jgi:hypothetical protein
MFAGIAAIIFASFAGISLLIHTLPPHMLKKKGLPLPGEDFDEIHQRLDDVDALQQRLADVEERLDFAERLLTGRTAPEQTPPAAG